MRAIVIISAVLVLTCAVGCGKKEEAEQKPQTAEQAPPPAAEVTEQEAPSILAKLKNATYSGIQEQDPVTLVDGYWEGEPFEEEGASRPSVQFVRDFHLLGDLDGDTWDEAAVVLAASSGGTGVNLYLAVLGQKHDEWYNLDTVLLGDRVQIRKSGILERGVFLDILRAGPEDPMSNPGELEGAAWRLDNGKLVRMEAASAPLRLSLDSITGPEWVLRWWDLEEEASAEPEVTLQVQDGQVGGSSGCNSYFAAVSAGDNPGDLVMGPTGGTMKMCEEDVMTIERRFLGRLDGLKKFGFVTGMLALTWELDGENGTMLFEARTPSK